MCTSVYQILLLNLKDSFRFSWCSQFFFAKTKTSSIAENRPFPRVNILFCSKSWSLSPHILISYQKALLTKSNSIATGQQEYLTQPNQIKFNNTRETPSSIDFWPHQNQREWTNKFHDLWRNQLILQHLHTPTLVNTFPFVLAGCTQIVHLIMDLDSKNTGDEQQQKAKIWQTKNNLWTWNI